jgi:hypothetical protein
MEAGPYPIQIDHARQGFSLQALGRGAGEAIWLSPQTKSFVRSGSMSLSGHYFSSIPCCRQYWHVRKNVGMRNRLYVAQQSIEIRRND